MLIFAPVVSLLSRASSTAKNEPSDQPSKTSSNNKIADDAKKEELNDPYDIALLPEKDRETDCFLCLTNRNGPCRNVWRPLEYCVKDQQTDRNQSEDHYTDDSLCDRYVHAFEECWSRHAALYLLISHQINQETMVRRIERDYKTNRPPPSKFAPSLDWTAYNEFWRDHAQQANEKVVQTNLLVLGEIRNADDKDPLWKRFDKQHVEPVVVNVSAQVPDHYCLSEKDGVEGEDEYIASYSLTLRVAYALDQDDNVVGLVGYVAATISENDETSPESEADTEPLHPSPDHSSSKLPVTILPGYTSSIRIKALYANEEYATLVSTRPIRV
jgi:hypothetical protein